MVFGGCGEEVQRCNKRLIMQKIANLDHSQGNGEKAIRYMTNTEDKQKTMELLQALL